MTTRRCTQTWRRLHFDCATGMHDCAIGRSAHHRPSCPNSFGSQHGAAVANGFNFCLLERRWAEAWFVYNGARGIPQILSVKAAKWLSSNALKVAKWLSLNALHLMFASA